MDFIGGFRGVRGREGRALGKILHDILFLKLGKLKILLPIEGNSCLKTSKFWLTPRNTDQHYP